MYRPREGCKQREKKKSIELKCSPITVHHRASQVHLHELEQQLELLKGLFELEVKVDNFDEVASQWELLFESTQKLHSKLLD